MDLNFPTKAKHVFGFKKETNNKNFRRSTSNVLYLESFMDNGDNLNNVFLVEKEDDEIDEHHQFLQFKKDDMYKMCRVNQERYESNTTIYDQNQKKLAKALNEAELVRLTTERHFKETMHDSSFLRMHGPDCAMPERIFIDRDFKDVVVRMSHDQTDLHIYQEIITRNLGRVENKIDHLKSMAEREM